MMGANEGQTLRVEVDYCNNKYFVWNANAVEHLRRKCRVVGSFVGCLPGYSYQNVQLGLPLQLMAEEVKLLLDKELCHLIRVERKVSSETADAYKKREEAVFVDYKKLLCEERRRQLEEKAADIMERKAQKMKGQTLSRKAVIDEELKRLPEITRDSYPIHLHTRCPFGQHLVNQPSNSCGLSFTADQVQQNKFLIYRDLWEKGYFVTNGFKFACDFLVYEGDPLLYHAKYMVICKLYNRDMPPLEHRIYERLSGQVKKETLLASATFTPTSSGLSPQPAIVYKSLSTQSKTKLS